MCNGNFNKLSYETEIGEKMGRALMSGHSFIPSITLMGLDK
jgi:hypothetical protein